MWPRPAAAVALVGMLLLVPLGRARPQASPAGQARPLTSQRVVAPDADELYAQGCARLHAGDTAAAVALLARAVARQPDKLDGALALVQAQAAAGDVSTALRLLDELEDTCADHVPLRTARAAIEAGAGHWVVVEDMLSPLEDRLDADSLVLLARACAKTGSAAGGALVLRRGLKRVPQSERLWLALVDMALEREQCGLALQQISQAQQELGPLPQFQLRAAQAHFGLGRVLGETRVLCRPGGRAGQFAQGWLLVEKRAEPDRFLCCPEQSALYAVRRALDAGVDEPAAHCLHARIWERAGRPEVGLAILRGREAVLLENPSSETLETFADVALAANALGDFLRYTRLHAGHDPERRTDILYGAYLAAAERYNERGDEAMYRELLRRALTLRPERVELMLRLADAVWDAGGREEAAIWYRRVLQREPAHQERSRILRRLQE